MGLFRRERRGYIDRREVSRTDAVGGALFIFSAAIVVAKVAEWQFDNIFFVAASVGLLLLLLTRHKPAYIAAALGWMAFRFALASVLQQDASFLLWAAGFGALAFGVIYIAIRRE